VTKGELPSTRRIKDLCGEKPKTHVPMNGKESKINCGDSIMTLFVEAGIFFR
jgi:hypothetical protein